MMGQQKLREKQMEYREQRDKMFDYKFKKEITDELIEAGNDSNTREEEAEYAVHFKGGQ